MTITTTQKVTAASNILIENLGAETVLLNLDTLVYTSQDDVGTRMFNLLIESESIDHAFQALLAEYEVEPTLLKKDLFDYIEQLLNQGLVEIKES